MAGRPTRAWWVYVEDRIPGRVLVYADDAEAAREAAVRDDGELDEFQGEHREIVRVQRMPSHDRDR